MLKSLLKFLLVVMILVFLIPLVLLLLGEGFAISKIFQLANRHDNDMEFFDDSGNSSFANIAITGEDVSVINNHSNSVNGSSVLVLDEFSLNHNILRDDENGMCVHLCCKVVNLKGEKMSCIVRFYDGDMKRISRKSSDCYSSKDGYLITFDTFTPATNNQIFYGDFYMPYYLFSTPVGKRTYFYVDVAFADSDGTVIFESAPSPFYLDR